MFTYCWMVAQTKGWASLRAPDVAGLAPLAGFAYMPSSVATIAIQVQEHSCAVT